MPKGGRNGDEIDIRDLARMLHSKRNTARRDPAGDPVFDAVEILAGQLKTDENGDRIGTMDDPQIVPRVKIVGSVPSIDRKKFANWIWKAGELHDVAARHRVFPNPENHNKIDFYIWVQYPPGSPAVDLAKLLNDED